MEKGKKILEVAKTQIGVKETPKNSNKTKFGVWFGLDGVPWCGVFVSWVYWKAGFSLGKVGFLKGFAGCQYAVDFYKKNNKVVEDPKPGDIVFFDWNLDGRYDHTGIFVENIDNVYFKTIEGNTSLTNDSNGGEVMERKRKKGKGVLYVRP